MPPFFRRLLRTRLSAGTHAGGIAVTAACVLAVSLPPQVLAAQVVLGAPPKPPAAAPPAPTRAPHTWSEALARASRTITTPGAMPDTAACPFRLVAPDSVAVDAWGNLPAELIFLWSDPYPGGTEPGWAALPTSFEGRDTFRAAVVGLRCGRVGGQTNHFDGDAELLLLRAENRVLGLNLKYVAAFDGPVGADGSYALEGALSGLGRVLVVRPGGRLSPALVERTAGGTERRVRDSLEVRAEMATRAGAARRAGAAARQARRREAAAEYRARGWPGPVIEAVLAGKVAVGMTPTQVRAAWGTPRDIHRTTTARGRDEQWVYGLSQYVYFTNGAVTAIQH